MKRPFAVITCLVIALQWGCSDTGKEGTSGKGAGKGIEVEWPGGHVKFDPEKGVDVRAPGVDVQVDKDTGVGVKAPGVDVQVDKDKNVGVKASGVDVDVQREASKNE